MKLPWGYDESDHACESFKARLREAVELLAAEGAEEFISGMAQGVDTFGAEAVLQLREKYPLRLVCALPCADQSRGWSRADADRYGKILALADETVCVSDQYSPACMMVRNRYMVERSDVIIAAFNGEKGGTRGTVEYAKRLCKRIIYVPPLGGLNESY